MPTPHTHAPTYIQRDRRAQAFLHAYTYAFSVRCTNSCIRMQIHTHTHICSRPRYSERPVLGSFPTYFPTHFTAQYNSSKRPCLLSRSLLRLAFLSLGLARSRDPLRLLHYLHLSHGSAWFSQHYKYYAMLKFAQPSVGGPSAVSERVTIAPGLASISAWFS